jgi:hypothetical protein
MTESRDKHPPEEDDDIQLGEKDEEAVRSLLRRSLGADSMRTSSPDLLRGVQKKIRQRSKGKFYGDGWSTTQSKVNYFLVALIMLVLLATLYFVLGPTGFSR